MGIDAIGNVTKLGGDLEQLDERTLNERWTVACPLLGEISSEERPGRASPELLALAAGRMPTRRRPLPRFATAPETIAEMVPGSETCELRATLTPIGVIPANEAASEEPGAGKARQLRKYRAKKREQHARQLAIGTLLHRQKLCHNCGKKFQPHGLFADRPELAERGGFDVLVCRECCGKVVRP